jgi:hypothetical protein
MYRAVADYQAWIVYQAGEKGRFEVAKDAGHGAPASCTVSRLLKIYCEGPSASLRGAHTFAYLHDMSQVLRSVRLAYGLSHNVFKQPVTTCHK